MKTNIIGSIIIVLILAGLFVWGRPGAGESEKVVARGTASQLTTAEVVYDFGTISMKDGNVAKEFVVTNPTDESITIATVITSCMCTNAFVVGSGGNIKGPFGMGGMGYVPPANETIKAGESSTIRVVYDPNAHGPAGVGQIDRFVTLTETSGAKLLLEIRALVTP